MINVVCITWTALFNRFLSSPTYSAWKYYFVFIVVLVATIANIWFFYPETAGRSLETIQVRILMAEQKQKNGKADDRSPISSYRNCSMVPEPSPILSTKSSRYTPRLWCTIRRAMRMRSSSNTLSNREREPSAQIRRMIRCWRLEMRSEIGGHE